MISFRKGIKCGGLYTYSETHSQVQSCFTFHYHGPVVNLHVDSRTYFAEARCNNVIIERSEPYVAPSLYIYHSNVVKQGLLLIERQIQPLRTFPNDDP